MVTTGKGLAALPKKQVSKILANEYIVFTELPPAKGKACNVPQSLEGQVLVVQASDLMRARKLIPDLATCVQCFALYANALLTHQLNWMSEIMVYQSIIARASAKYKWPPWVVYDQNFRQEAMNNPSQSWAREELSIYAQCFTGQAISLENWCAHCQGLDHTTMRCLLHPRKRTWTSAFPQTQQVKADKSVRIKYNRFNGDCKFGRECRFLHVCSSCGGSQPANKCKAEGSKSQ